MNRAFAVSAASIALLTTACVGLAPRTTLEGRPFAAQHVAGVYPGQTEDEIRALLGEPYEFLKNGDIETWRYYERFTPRGCDTPKPIITRDFKVRFREGVVVGTEPAQRLDGKSTS